MSAAALLLELRARGLAVSAEGGAVVVVRGLHALPAAEADHLRDRIRRDKPALLRLLRGADPGALAVLSEGGHERTAYEQG